MPKYTSMKTLDKALSKLTKQWHEHRNGLAKIQAIFSKYGINPSKAVPPAVQVQPEAAPATRAPSARKGKMRPRLAVSGSNFVLDLLGSDKVMTTAQIAAEWSRASRPGKADQPLSKLVKDKKVKREPVKTGKGSKYSLA